MDIFDDKNNMDIDIQQQLFEMKNSKRDVDKQVKTLQNRLNMLACEESK